MNYTESTKYALEQESVNAAFEEAKKSGTVASRIELGNAINKERAKFLKAKGWSNAAIAEELNTSEAVVRNIIFG